MSRLDAGPGRYAARRFGPLIVTTCRQPGGQPIVDAGTTFAADGSKYGSWTIRLRSTPGRALVVGWRGIVASTPRRPRWLFGFRPVPLLSWATTMRRRRP